MQKEPYLKINQVGHSIEKKQDIEVSTKKNCFSSSCCTLVHMY